MMPNYFVIVILIMISRYCTIIADNENNRALSRNSSAVTTTNNASIFARSDSKNEKYDETRCSSSLIFNLKTRTCVDEETFDLINSRPSCKNITLKLATFSVSQDGLLTINRSNATFTKYNLTNNSATLCFPFTSHFLSCIRWKLSAYEFELRNDDLTLWDHAHQVLLENGEFFFKDDGNPVTCMDTASLSASLDVIEAEQISTVYTAMWTISAISLAISLIVYYLVHQKMKYQTKILMCHMTSLLLFYVILIIRSWGPIFTPEACIPYTFFVHYFFLSAFFWINVLAYDIWKNLTRFSTIELAPSNTTYRFIFMCSYACGCPLVIAITAVLVDKFLPEGSSLKPNFAENCWFGSLESKVLFMFGPAAILMTTNLIFFALTVYNLRRIGKSALLVNKKIHKQLLKMYCKLLVVMGLCWSMEIISGVVEFTRYSYVPDIINGLQGFLLFLVYVCKPKILRNLKSLWENNVANCRRLRSNIETQENGSSIKQHTSITRHSSQLSSSSGTHLIT